jgi:hypothetical protein
MRLFVKVSFSTKTKTALTDVWDMRQEACEGAEVWIEITALLHGQ